MPDLNTPSTSTETGHTVVLFDWNGTLIDDVKRAWMATATVARRRQLPVPDLDRFRDTWRLPLAAHLADLGITDTKDAAGEWNAELQHHDAPLQPSARDLLAALAQCGIRTGIVSAAGSSVHRDIDAHQLGELVASVHTDVHDKAAVLRNYTAEFPEVHYIGDTEHDIECALAAGVHAIGYSGGYRPADALHKAGAALVIDDLSLALRAIDTLSVARSPVLD